MKHAGLVLGLCALLTLTGNSLQAEDKWWEHELTFDSLPSEQEPSWSMRGSRGEPSLKDGKLILKTADENQSIAYVLDEGTSHESATVEFKVQATEVLGRFAAQFNLGWNGQFFVIPISNPEAKTYRAVLEGGSVTLYVDGSSPTIIRPVPDTKTSSPGKLLFGDASSAAIGTTEWSNLRWIWGQAVHP